MTRLLQRTYCYTDFISAYIKSNIKRIQVKSVLQLSVTNLMHLNSLNSYLYQCQVTGKINEGCHTVSDTPSKIFSRPKTRQSIYTNNKFDEGKICVTYVTADCYRLTELKDHVAKDVHLQHVHLPIEFKNAVVFCTSESHLLRNEGTGYILFFKEGAISFWNIAESAAMNYIKSTRNFEKEPYKAHLIKWENEQMEYAFESGQTKFEKNCLKLCETSSLSRTCSEMYAFSNALVVSVKLAHWEHSLDHLIRSIESFPRALMRSNLLRYKTSKSVIQTLGQVFMIRHRLNLQYNLLDVPDVYWDREELEQLYVQTTEFLNITRRVKIMNEKLSYCAHVVELVKSHLAEQKSIRVEVLIVILILIEVIFEIFHFFVKPVINEKLEKLEER